MDTTISLVNALLDYLLERKQRECNAENTARKTENDSPENPANKQGIGRDRAKRVWARESFVYNLRQFFQIRGYHENTDLVVTKNRQLL